MVSVIIPIYNAENTIEKCVESIVYGQLHEIEIILIDDCSKDASWNICQLLSIKFPNVFCYQNKKNSGVSYTRNYGLGKANGKYILFVDSDDWVSGKYAYKLLENALQYTNSLIICGLHYHDNILGEKRDYVWEKDGEQMYFVKSEDYFELQTKFHLQQLWNKIFRKDIIDHNNIRFDITKSMGEDFQFVLEYIEAADIKQCVVLNEALYYYIRSNEFSLMSQFGLIENGDEYERLKKLSMICGESLLTVQNQYLIALRSIKNSYVYFIAREKNKSKKEKIVLIEKIMQDGQATYYYHQQEVIKLKEKIVIFRKNLFSLFKRIQQKIQRFKNQRVIFKIRKQLKDKNISIISQNCIGGVFYHDMGLQFQSPTINLYFKCPDFVRLVLNLRYYMEMELKMEWEEEYPIGILGDIKIHFMHYQTCTEAKQAWERRKKRIIWDKIIVISTDMEDFSEETFKLWKTIEYPKILYSAKQWEDESCVWLPKYKHNGKVGDLIPKREFYKVNGCLKNI